MDSTMASVIPDSLRLDFLPGSEAGLDVGGREGRLDPPADLACAEVEHKATPPPIRVSEFEDLAQGFHGWFGEEQDNAFPLPINVSCDPGQKIQPSGSVIGPLDVGPGEASGLV